MTVIVEKILPQQKLRKKDTYKYEYDTNGNITDIYKKVNNDWQRLYLYEYDEFNQLITSCDYINQKQYRYDYDEAGNILTETVSRIGAHGQLYDSRVNTYGYDDANWGDKLTSYNGESSQPYKAATTVSAISMTATA